MNIHQTRLSTAVFLSLLTLGFFLGEKHDAVAKFSQINQQRTTINLRQTELKTPHLLTITVPRAVTTLSGKIELDGKVIKNLDHSNVSLNLAPFLTPGRHTLSIQGNYSPQNESIMIDFLGKNTQVSQSASGSGQINQTIIMEVSP